MTGTANELSPLDKFMLVKNAIPRPGYMADFEGIAAFLASDSSSFITGETITVDGGAMVMMYASPLATTGECNMGHVLNIHKADDFRLAPYQRPEARAADGALRGQPAGISDR